MLRCMLWCSASFCRVPSGCLCLFALHIRCAQQQKCHAALCPLPGSSAFLFSLFGSSQHDEVPSAAMVLMVASVHLPPPGSAAAAQAQQQQPQGRTPGGGNSGGSDYVGATVGAALLCCKCTWPSCHRHTCLPHRLQLKLITPGSGVPQPLLCLAVGHSFPCNASVLLQLELTDGWH